MAAAAATPRFLLAEPIALRLQQQDRGAIGCAGDQQPVDPSCAQLHTRCRIQTSTV
jgi:hypothetical protein